MDVMYLKISRRQEPPWTRPESGGPPLRASHRDVNWRCITSDDCDGAIFIAMLLMLTATSTLFEDTSRQVDVLVVELN